MSLYNFTVVATMTAFASLGSLYSLDATAGSTPQMEVVEEVSLPVVEEEVNPIEIEEEIPHNPAPYEGKTWHGSGVIYTQDVVRLLPGLEPICRCESGKQFHPDGTVVRGVVNPQDIGMCQINLKYHGEAAEKLGYDLFTEIGNIRYTNYLYTMQGAQPWYLSKPCHGIG